MLSKEDVKFLVNAGFADLPNLFIAACFDIFFAP
jgi:hypothetical protein